MRFSTIVLSALGGMAALVLAQEPFSLSEDVAVRDNGDVNIFERREITIEEIVERDTAYSLATGESLEARDFLSEDEMHDIAERHLSLELDGRGELAEELERRGKIAIAKAVVKGIIRIVNVIKGMIAKDKARRGQFTSDLIKQSRAKYPGWNWVICHTRHKYNFAGQRGKDWGHRHEEFKVSFGKTIGYEIYWFKKGTFTRQGDGGYLNWAYGGRVKSKSKNGMVVTFV